MTKYLKKVVVIIFPILNFMVGIITLKIISNSIPIQDYGTLSLLISIFTFFFLFISAGIPQGIVRFYPSEKDQEHKFGFQKLILKYSIPLIIVLSAAGAFILKALNMSLDLHLDDSLLLIIFVYLTVYSMVSQLNSFNRVEMRNIQYNIIGFLEKSLLLILFIWFVTVMKTGSIKSYYLAYVAVSFVLVFMLLITLDARKILQNTICIDSKIIWEIIKYSIPIIGISLAGDLLIFGSRFIINFFMGKSELGIFSGCYSVANGLYSIFFLPISIYLLPAYVKIFRLQGEEAVKRYINMIFRLIVLLIYPIAIFSFFYRDEIIRLLLNNSFTVGSLCMPVILLGNIFYCFYYIAATEFFVKKNTAKLLVYITGAALINLALNFVLIPRMGILGAAMASFLANLSLFCLIYLNQTYLCITKKYFIDVVIVVLSVLVAISLFHMQLHYILNGLIITIVYILLLYAFLKESILEMIQGLFMPNQSA